MRGKAGADVWRAGQKELGRSEERWGIFQVEWDCEGDVRAGGVDEETCKRQHPEGFKLHDQSLKVERKSGNKVCTSG